MEEKIDYLYDKYGGSFIVRGDIVIFLPGYCSELPGNICNPLPKRKNIPASTAPAKFPYVVKRRGPRMLKVC